MYTGPAITPKIKEFEKSENILNLWDLLKTCISHEWMFPSCKGFLYAEGRKKCPVILHWRNISVWYKMFTQVYMWHFRRISLFPSTFLINDYFILLFQRLLKQFMRKFLSQWTKFVLKKSVLQCKCFFQRFNFDVYMYIFDIYNYIFTKKDTLIFVICLKT